MPRLPKTSLTLALIALSCVLLSACEGDVSDTVGGLDLSPPDLWTPPDTGGGGSDGYGSSGGSSGAGQDTAEDTAPDVPVVPCDEITFEYQGAATRVLVTGSFVGWAATEERGALALSESAPGEWRLTTTIADRGQHFYKLIVDDVWISDPANDQRSPDHLGGQNSVVEVCEPLPEQPCGVVHFTYDAPDAASVQVAGDFTDPPWAEGAMALDASSGRWRLTSEVSEGDHQYKFIVTDRNGVAQWYQDPQNPEQADDGVGGFNSALSVSCESRCGDVTAFDWRDAVLYFAMVDRFYDSDRASDPVPGATGDNGAGASGQYEGGDLAGVTAKMDYLADLGVTALWLSAPYDNREGAGAAIDTSQDNNQYSAYHGYWPSPLDVNYSGSEPSPTPEVESRISATGDGDAELRALIDAAHEADSANGHGIKVLFDYVMNHVDADSPLHQQHPDWFATNNGQTVLCAGDAVCGGACWEHPEWGTKCAFTDYLPPFDYSNAEARAWSIDDAVWWAKEYGIDGYRLDAIKHVPFAWLTDLRARLNQEFPSPDGDRFYLVGETFDWGNRDLLKAYVDPETMLDGQFDFPLRKELCEATMGGGDLAGFSGWLRDNDQFYGPTALMSTWVGNHDIPRVIHNATGQFGCTQGSYPAIGWTHDYSQPSDAAPYEKLRVAFALLLTNPGVPLIYYGDEIGLAGGGDPDNRRMMIWDDASLNAHQRGLRERVRSLARIRGENKAITRGRRSTLSVSADAWVYRLGGCGGDAADVIVAVNRSGGVQTVSIPAGQYTDLSTGGAHQGGQTSIPARDYVILRAD